MEIEVLPFQFLTEGGISGEKLQKELDRIYRQQTTMPQENQRVILMFGRRPEEISRGSLF